MKFRTEIPIPTYPWKIDYTHQLMCMGSCFAEHIGDFFKKNRFHTLVNPFGTLFNPMSIANGIELALHPENFSDNLVTLHNREWISFAHHGKFSHANKTLFFEQINQQLNETHTFLTKTDFLFLTFGTAYVYRHVERNFIVANCHKMPASTFEKYRLTIDDIVEKYRWIIHTLQSINPMLKIIFTVSPVRHLADGFHENQLSKSILHLAIEKILEKTSHTFYFPAYEILNDDLRDYRFYGEDLCHPNDVAISYMKEMIIQSFFSKETELERKKVEKERKRAEHRPIR